MWRAAEGKFSPQTLTTNADCNEKKQESERLKGKNSQLASEIRTQTIADRRQIGQQTDQI